MKDGIASYGQHEFGPEFEDALISIVTKSTPFVSKFRSILTPDAFLDADKKFVVSIVLGYFDKYSKLPSKNVLIGLIKRSNYRDKGLAIEVVENVEKCDDTDFVAEQVLSWSKWNRMSGVIDGYDGDDATEFASQIEEAARIGDDLLFEHTDLTKADKITRRETIETPWDWLNLVTDGGPEKGDLSVVITVIGGGKTTALVNIAKHALKLGKFVVYLTFEDGETKIKRRFMQSIGDMTKREVIANITKARFKVNNFISKNDGRCEIKMMTTNISTVADAVSFIRNLEDVRRRKVDMVITDYADRFGSKIRYREPRHKLREIFEDCKAMAMSLDVVHWTARQVAKEAVGKSVVTYEKASESWGSMESPDLVIGIGRTMEDEQMGRMTLYTSKVRDSQDHQKTSLIVDFDKQSIIGVNEMGEDDYG